MTKVGHTWLVWALYSDEIECGDASWAHSSCVKRERSFIFLPRCPEDQVVCLTLCLADRRHWVPHSLAENCQPESSGRLIVRVSLLFWGPPGWLPHLSPWSWATVLESQLTAVTHKLLIQPLATWPKPKELAPEGTAASSDTWIAQVTRCTTFCVSPFLFYWLMDSPLLRPKHWKPWMGGNWFFSGDAVCFLRMPW